jgi:hypothetical protein
MTKPARPYIGSKTSWEREHDRISVRMAKAGYGLRAKRPATPPKKAAKARP